MTPGGAELEGVLLDIDGVLVTAWKPLPGARSALEWLRRSGIAFRLMTNTTSHTRAVLAGRLREMGFPVGGEDVVTAAVATAEYLRRHHAGARCFLLGQPDVLGDLEGIDLVSDRDDVADVVVVAGADAAFTWENVNRAFRMLLGGAALVAMHRNLSWTTEEGLTLDSGAYLLGLERASGTSAVVCGKPSPEFFRRALDLLGTAAERTAMVGDDIETDVLAAQRLGLTGILVRTGKFRSADVDSAVGRPDHVIESIAALPAMLRER
jgi:HAD superfamily hydrolase (TIGR01458 family)